MGRLRLGSVEEKAHQDAKKQATAAFAKWSAHPRQLAKATPHDKAPAGAGRIRVKGKDDKARKRELEQMAKKAVKDAENEASQATLGDS